MTKAKVSNNQKLFRSEQNKILGGVAGGLGEFFDIDPTIIRLIFVLITIFGGAGVLLYIILWLIIPAKSNLSGTSEEHIKANITEIKGRAEKFAADLSTRKTNESDNRNLWGILIVLVGGIFLLQNFNIFGFLNFGKLWPILLIVFGLIILMRRR